MLRGKNEWKKKAKINPWIYSFLEFLPNKKLPSSFRVIIYVTLLLIFFQCIPFHHFFNIWRFMIMKTTQVHDIIFICGCCAFAFIAFLCTTPKYPISFFSVPSINVISLVYQLSSSKLGNCVPLDFLYIVQIWKVEEKINEKKVVEVYSFLHTPMLLIFLSFIHWHFFPIFFQSYLAHDYEWHLISWYNFHMLKLDLYTYSAYKRNISKTFGFLSSFQPNKYNFFGRPIMLCHFLKLHNLLLPLHSWDLKCGGNQNVNK